MGRMRLIVVLIIAIAGCAPDAQVDDPVFAADYVDDYEHDLEEDAAEEAEQAEVDQYDDLDEIDQPDVEPAPTVASLQSNALHSKKIPPRRPPHGPLSILQDDTSFYTASLSEDRLSQAKALGADAIRVLIWWHLLLPHDADGSLKRPAVPSKPDEYNWEYFDREVDGARAHGLKVLLTIPAGPAPSFAREQPERCDSPDWCSWMPKPKEYAALVAAIGRHVRAKRQSVWAWTFVNEPNIETFVDGPTPRARAMRYRALWFTARKALRKTAGVNARVLFGDFSNNPKSLSPSAWKWRTFNDALCLKEKLDPDPTAKCDKNPRRVHAAGIAWHPYSSTPDEVRDSVAFLQQLVDDAAAAGALDRNRGLYMTEGAFLTAAGATAPGLGGGRVVTPDQQAIYMNLADHALSKMPRVKSLAQYELVDEGMGTFDCGLRWKRVRIATVSGEVEGELREMVTNDHLVIVDDADGVHRIEWAEFKGIVATLDQGRPKPSYGAYRVAIAADKTSDQITIWGLARADTGAGFTIEALYPTGWREITNVQTDALGFGEKTIAIGAATAWRIRFGGDYSREVR